MNKYDRLKTLLTECEYIVPSYTYYGGLSGFQDFGILGTKLKNKLLDLWRNAFIENSELNIYEVDAPTIVPFDILKASGHVDNFTDYIVQDSNKRIFRADTILKQYYKENGMVDLIDLVNGWNAEKIQQEIIKYNVLNDPSNNFLQVKPRNLMCTIAACSNTDTGIDFLRPEIAQTIFVNYNRFKNFLKRDVFFGIAQIGKSYRKEISPVPYTRLREFYQAEIEYFFDPQNDNYDFYENIKNYEIPLLNDNMQINKKPTKIMKVSDAIDNKIISNKLIAYFLVNIHKFALSIGLNKDLVRFRQHMRTEMAHYALECWDLDVLINDDWLECVGVANRGSYDLQSHSTTNSESHSLTARRKLINPIIEAKLKIIPNKKIIGEKYKELTSTIIDHFSKLNQQEILNMSNLLDVKDSIYICINESMYIITKDMLQILQVHNKIEYEDYYPNIIEPSFGIDRIIYALLVHTYWERNSTDNKIKPVLSLPYKLSPYHIAIFPQFNENKMNVITNNLITNLKSKNLNIYTDKSAANIGKKYIRSDEIGIKYAITIDPETINDNCVTVRTRDDMSQIRINIDDLINSDYKKIFC